MSSLLVLHLLFVGLWLGCAAAETVLELLSRGAPSLRNAVAMAHPRIDLFVELPAAAAVLVTGALMLDFERMSGVYLLKVVSGALAIFGSAAVVIPVVRRKRFAATKREEQAQKESRLILLAVMLNFPFAAVALVAGLYMLGIL